MHPLFELGALCTAIFTGLPPRLKAGQAASSPFSAPVIGIKSLTHDGCIEPGLVERYALDKPLTEASRPLLPGDVLFTIRGSAVKTGLVEHSFDESTYASGNLAVLRPDRTRLAPAFLWACAKAICEDERHPLLTRASTGQLAIRVAALARLPLPLPSLGEQQEIGCAALALRKAVTAQRETLRRSERTLHAFLSDYFPRP